MACIECLDDFLVAREKLAMAVRFTDLLANDEHALEETFPVAIRGLFLTLHEIHKTMCKFDPESVRFALEEVPQ